MIKWVLRGGRGVDTDPEARVWFQSLVVEVVGLWGQSRAGDRPEREALRDECRPVIHRRGLLVSPIYFVVSVFFFQGDGGALENLCSRLCRGHGE